MKKFYVWIIKCKTLEKSPEPVAITEGRDIFEARRHAIADLNKKLKPNEFIAVSTIN